MATHGELQSILDAGDAAAVNAFAKAHGFVAWNIDPVLASTQATQSVVAAGAVFLAKGDVINGIAIPVQTAGATMTFAGVGIYDVNLNLLSGINNNGAAFQSTGWVPTALSAPFVVPYSGLYYLASGFAGTTTPSVLNFVQATSMSTAPAGQFPRGVKGSAPGASMPNPLVSVGIFANQPVLAAY